MFASKTVRPISVACLVFVTTLFIALAGGSAQSSAATARPVGDQGSAVAPGSQTATATPSFKPAGGSYTAVLSVTLKDTTSGAAIYYTTDGRTTPTAKSTRYSAPIPVSRTETILAVAIAPGHSVSAVAKATYTLPPAAAAPQFHPAGGSFPGPQSVVLASATAGARIYYSTDGKTKPTTGSTLYTAPFAVSKTTTVQAIAVASGHLPSAVVEGVYTIKGNALDAPAPVITTTPALSGAVIVSLVAVQPNAGIYFTLDGSTPTTTSQLYQAPFLVARNLTVKAISTAGGYRSSVVAQQAFQANIPSGRLVWSDEFANSSKAKAQPNPNLWTYDTGNWGWGNNELEDYCAWGSEATPCDPSEPNAFVGLDGSLHIVARQPSTGVYTSARVKSQGLFSFLYGRLEVKASVPEGQGFWPAIWLLGNNIATINWPGCGEQDMVERIDAAASPDWNAGSIHGTNFVGGNLGTHYYFPSGHTAAEKHVYGMIWKPGSISYYVDDPAKPYATYTPASLNGLSGAVWPFDSGNPAFLIFNVAVGGSWPGSPDSTTVFPSEMVVDYVRIYAE